MLFSPESVVLIVSKSRRSQKVDRINFFLFYLTPSYPIVPVRPALRAVWNFSTRVRRRAPFPLPSSFSPSSRDSGSRFPDFDSLRIDNDRYTNPYRIVKEWYLCAQDKSDIRGRADTGIGPSRFLTSTEYAVVIWCGSVDRLILLRESAPATTGIPLPKFAYERMNIEIGIYAMSEADW